MIVPLYDSTTGVTVYVDPSFVMTLRPDPEHPLDMSLIKLKDGETLHVQGEHREIADKLAYPPA
ncbi:MAG: hypothetical protein JWO87_2815 [Phycisphaerales bacterium]|jgi:hypothetical protein|nr:hypothetical protein [Phycisphaerales bacterium]MDB5301152.1 hypothetical protein [Phycisphaerales bacterium]